MQTPSFTQWRRCPVVTAIALCAIGITIWWGSGGDIRPLEMNGYAWSGQFWRLVTSILPHIDILHLVFNIYWLWVFGTRVEIVYGPGRTLLLIMLFAAGSSAAQYALSGPGVGLSGVGYGLFGLLWVLSRSDRRFYGIVDQSTVQLFVGWFFLCIVLTVAKVWHVANVAHGMGAILGVLLGYAVSAPARKFRLLSGGALAVLVAASLAAGAWGLKYVNFSDGLAREVQLHACEGYRAHVAKNYSLAIKEYRRALALDDNRADLWQNLGLEYIEIGADSEAQAAFLRAFELYAKKAESRTKNNGGEE
jgi:membrane associated rhomboid family serine protease